MPTVTQQGAEYDARRAWIAEYFDRTAVHAWAQLTSDAPVGRVRASVRKGRETMRGVLSAWLPQDLRGARILDAGCGTGLLATDLAARGAHVVAIDLSPTLVALARERAPGSLLERLDFRAGDMLDASLGTFDYVVAMDSFIHYRAPEMLNVVSSLAERTRSAMVFTVVPSTPLLRLMRAVGRAFPRGNRAPAVEPIASRVFAESVEPLSKSGWHLERTQHVSSGFYTSQACELVRRESSS